MEPKEQEMMNHVLNSLTGANMEPRTTNNANSTKLDANEILNSLARSEVNPRMTDTLVYHVDRSRPQHEYHYSMPTAGMCEEELETVRKHPDFCGFVNQNRQAIMVRKTDPYALDTQKRLGLRKQLEQCEKDGKLGPGEAKRIIESASNKEIEEILSKF
jgi:hypothetical protein